MLISVPFMLSSILYGVSNHFLHLSAISSVIIFQIYMSKRSFNTCGTCGHERHMHNKRDLNKSGHTSLAKVVCDNFKKGKWERNYQSKYWSGEDTTKKWDNVRDK